MKKHKPLFTLVLLALLGLSISACSGGAIQASGWPGLTANETTAFVAYNNHVYAVNVSNGTEKWRFPVEAEGNTTFYAKPAFGDDELLVVGDYNSVLHLLKADSGSETIIAGKWPFEQAKDPYIARPLTTADGIYAASSDSQLYALDFAGNPLWQPFKTGEAIWATPAVDEENLYVASLDHRLYAIDLSTGREVWSVDLGGALVGTPALNAAGILFIGTFGSEMVALEAATSEIVWRFPTADWVWSGPVLDDNLVYFGDLSGELYAVNQESGALAWSYTSDGAITSTPLIHASGIYFTTESGSLIALNANGTPRWTKTIDGKLHSTPVQIDDKILVSPIENDAYIFAFNLDGGQVWTFIPEN